MADFDRDAFDKINLQELPPHALQAMREENEKFRQELRQFGPHIVPMYTLKPRLRAAMDEAIRQNEQKAPE
jgi:hypothetical protein